MLQYISNTAMAEAQVQFAVELVTALPAIFLNGIIRTRNPVFLRHITIVNTLFNHIGIGIKIVKNLHSF